MSSLNRQRPARHLIDALALALVTSGVVWLAAYWAALPARVPLHFNLAQPPSFGPKVNLLILPAAALLLYLLFSYTLKIGVLNLPDAGSPEKNRELARRASVALRLISVAIVTAPLVGIVVSQLKSGSSLAVFALILTVNTLAFAGIYRRTSAQATGG